MPRKKAATKTPETAELPVCQCKPEIKDKLNSVHEELYGNGNSNNSHVTRRARVETNMKILLGVSTTQFFMLVGVAIKMFFSP
ncbi:MAG: hypothetical protein Q8M98_11910, partial [Candidatus Cloacimonadaceae bacterium]|nr:hypothetical protein [Candidatus Cloacimonadaceae bacterium]